MKKISIILSLIVLGCITAIGQLRLGEFSIGLQILSIVQTDDGGYAMSGGGWTVIKLDSNGNLSWTRTLAGTNNYAVSIIQTKDKGYAVAGYSSYGGMTLEKLDAKGNAKWIEAINNKVGWSANCSSIVQAKDGGYVLSGSSDSGSSGVMFIVKTDSTGNIKWACEGIKGGSSNEVVQTSDGGFVASGPIGSNGIPNGVTVVKLDSTGKSQWDIDISGYQNLYGTSIAQTIDKGYVVSASRLAGGSPGNYIYDMYIIKLDSLGHLKWNWQIARDQSDWGNSVVATKDGGCLIAGTDYTTSNMYAVRLDSAGNLIWDRTYLGQTELGNSVIQTKDNGFALAGGTFIKVDSMGNACEATGYGGSNFTKDTFFVTNTTGMINTTATISNFGNGSIDTSAAAITSICQIVSVEAINAQPKSLAVFPTPGNGLFQLRINNYESGINSTVEVYNVLGQKIYSQFTTYHSQFTINLADQPDGVYLYRVLAKDGSLVGSGKLVIEK